ncbi:MAG: 4Fe-4S binding protein, partial [Propionibacterium sp.]|nr:4Fe-4S binding protein [Propionibacterium sp.]
MSRRAMFGLRTAVDTEPDDPPQAVPAGDTPRELLLSVATDPPLPRLVAEEGCTGCQGCVRICPTDALSFADGTLSFDPAACVACGECVRTCPEAVLELEGKSSLGVDEIAHVPEQRCERCRGRLGPGEAGTCHR